MSLQVGDSERFVEAAAHIAAYPWLDASVRAEFFAYAENYTRKWFPRLRPSSSCQQKSTFNVKRCAKARRK